MDRVLSTGTADNDAVSRAFFELQIGRLIGLTAGPSASSTSSSSTSVVNQRYVWDGVSRLKRRVDGIGNDSGVAVMDTFSYDSLGRLTQYQVSGNGVLSTRTFTMEYKRRKMEVRYSAMPLPGDFKPKI